MKNTALLVVDVQESFKHREYWYYDGFAEYEERQNWLIDTVRAQGGSIVFILHNEDKGAFSVESGFVRLMDFLHKQDEDKVFNKRVHNALLDSGLHEWLQAQSITKLLVSGLRTEQCCETTTRVASDLGYEVDFVVDATHTFNMKNQFTGETVSEAAIKQHTCMVLQDRFANVRMVGDYE